MGRRMFYCSLCSFKGNRFNIERHVWIRHVRTGLPGMNEEAYSAAYKDKVVMYLQPQAEAPASGETSTQNSAPSSPTWKASVCSGSALVDSIPSSDVSSASRPSSPRSYSARKTSNVVLSLCSGPSSKSESSSRRTTSTDLAWRGGAGTHEAQTKSILSSTDHALEALKHCHNSPPELTWPADESGFRSVLTKAATSPHCLRSTRSSPTRGSQDVHHRTQPYPSLDFRKQSVDDKIARSASWGRDQPSRSASSGQLHPSKSLRSSRASTNVWRPWS